MFIDDILEKHYPRYKFITFNRGKTVCFVIDRYSGEHEYIRINEIVNTIMYHKYLDKIKDRNRRKKLLRLKILDNK